MAGIRQFQRYAIESVSGHLKSMRLHPGYRFFLDGEEEIFLLGISECVGSCGDMKYVDFAVFGSVPNDFIFDRPYDVSGCVFLRNATRDEERAEGVGVESLTLVVEALQYPWPEGMLGTFDFDRTGFKKVYKPTIC